MRDAVTNDANVYVKAVLPASIYTVQGLKEVMDYFSALEFEQWKTVLEEILEDVRKYKNSVEAVQTMHEEILVPLKKHQGQADVILKEFELEREKYQKEIKRMSEESEIRYNWALGLALIPFVNAIASPILNAQARNLDAEVLAKRAQVRILVETTDLVKGPLLEGMKALIEGIEHIAKFFTLIESQLTAFVKQGDKAVKLNKDEIKKKQKIFFILMQSKAKEIQVGFPYKYWVYQTQKQ